MPDTTTRFGIIEPSADRHDLADVPLYIRNVAQAVENLGAKYGQGTFANIPAAGAANQGMLYFATDQNRAYYCTGAAWIDLVNIANGTVTDAMLASPNNAAYRLVAQASSPASGLAASSVSLFSTAGLLTAVGGAVTGFAGVPLVEILASNFAVPGKTAKLSIRGIAIINATDPAATINFRLYPITPGGGGAGAVAVTIGAAVVSSGNLLISPGTSAFRVDGADTNLPADGVYALGVSVSTNPMAANSAALLSAQLMVRYV